MPMCFMAYATLTEACDVFNELTWTKSLHLMSRRDSPPTRKIEAKTYRFSPRISLAYRNP